MTDGASVGSIFGAGLIVFDKIDVLLLDDASFGSFEDFFGFGFMLVVFFVLDFVLDFDFDSAISDILFSGLNAGTSFIYSLFA